VIEPQGTGTRPSKLTLFAGDGHPLGTVDVPRLNQFTATFSGGGKYILAATDNAIAPIKIVPVAGGPIRQITAGVFYDWMGGWTPDGKGIEVETVDQGRQVYSIYSLQGELLSKIPYPEDSPGIEVYGINQGYLVYRVGNRNKLTGWRLMAMNLADRSRKLLVDEILIRGGSPAGGMYNGLGAGEFYYRQQVGSRFQLRARTVLGGSRLIGEFPLSLADAVFHIYKDRVVYRETGKDSVRLQLSPGPGKPVRTIGTFSKTEGVGEFAWSYDGRRLAVSVGSLPPQRMLLYRFDASGAVEGSPQSFTLPFDYWYETFWLPDGSGLTMIVQVHDKGNTDIALVKLADPLHPILLAAEDPHSKWGHSLSPDGRYVAYPSEEIRGTSIYLLEVAELLKRMKSTP
jgi:Tol biopolymer transport system component